MPSTAVTFASSGAAPSPSPALPARTSTPSTSSESSSTMTSSLWPSKRRDADLRPWRISGSECDTTRSGATPWRTAGPPSVSSTSWRTTWDNSSAASATSASPASSLRRPRPTRRRQDHQFRRVRLAHGGVLPVDVGLGRRQSNAFARRSASRWPPMARARRPVNSGPARRCPATAPAPCTGEESMIAVTLFEDPRRHRLSKVFLNSVVRVVQHHPRPHQAERGRPDPLEPVVDTHRRLPVRVHPGTTGGLTSECVMGGTQHGPHHHRRGDRRPPFSSAYSWAKSSSEMNSWPWSASRS